MLIVLLICNLVFKLQRCIVSVQKLDVYAKLVLLVYVMQKFPFQYDVVDNQVKLTCHDLRVQKGKPIFSLFLLRQGVTPSRSFEVSYMLVQCPLLQIVKQKRNTYLPHLIRVRGVPDKYRCLIRVGHGYVTFFELSLLPKFSKERTKGFGIGELFLLVKSFNPYCK